MSMSLYEVKAAINALVLKEYARIDQLAADCQAVAPSVVGMLAEIGAVAPVEFKQHVLGWPSLTAYFDDAGQELAIVQAVETWADKSDFELIWKDCSSAARLTHFASLRGRDDCRGQYLGVAVMPAREVCGHGI